jgi:hypothetical protein
MTAEIREPGTIIDIPPNDNMKIYTYDYGNQKLTRKYSPKGNKRSLDTTARIEEIIKNIPSLDLKMANTYKKKYDCYIASFCAPAGVSYQLFIRAYKQYLQKEN